MDDLELAEWKTKVTLVHRKEGRTLITAILHVEGVEEPPFEALLSAAMNWERCAHGQAVRRPDECGKQVYWVNVAK